MRPAARSIAALLLIALSACSASDSTAPVQSSASSVSPAAITQIDLGTLGGSYSTAADINNAGTVVGWSTTAQGTNRAFRWTPKGGMVALPLPPGFQWSQAVGITPLGKIIGFGDSAGGLGRPVWWSSAGLASAPPIPAPQGALIVNPFAMNDLNQVVGYSFDDSSFPRGFHWSRALGYIDLSAVIPGNYEAYPSDITSWGLTVGTHSDCVTAGCAYRAFTWRPLLGYYNLGVPAGSPALNAAVSAQRSNELGQIVGWTELQAPPGIHAFRWEAQSGFTLLPPLVPALSSAYAAGINLTGTVVGGSLSVTEDFYTAVVWPATGGVVALNPGDLSGSVAWSVNDRGVVAGSASTSTGTHATVWRLPSGLIGSTPRAEQVSDAASPHVRSIRRGRLAECLYARGVPASRVEIMTCMGKVEMAGDWMGAGGGGPR